MSDAQTDDQYVNEKSLMHKIMLALTRVGSRVFRNQVGDGWYGNAQRITIAGDYSLYPGDVVVRGARRLKAGLIKGSADVVGWTTVKVTQEMVGHDHALFTAVEVKYDDGIVTGEQDNFIRAVKAAGGIAIVARSIDEAVNAVQQKGVGNGETGIHRS